MPPRRLRKKEEMCQLHSALKCRKYSRNTLSVSNDLTLLVTLLATHECSLTFSMTLVFSLYRLRRASEATSGMPLPVFMCEFPLMEKNLVYVRYIPNKGRIISL